MVNLEPADPYPNWFQQTAQPNFQRYLGMVAGRANLRFLQVGAFTGDASVWMLENVLTHSSSRLVDVDPWQAYGELTGEGLVGEEWDWEEVYRLYWERVDQYGNKVTAYRGESLEFFSHIKEAFPQTRFDFIYIDGAHDAVSVLEDAVNAYRVLKPRGILAFDDYTWSAQDTNPLKAPAPAIDAIRYIYRDKLTTIGVGAQVWMVKNQ